MTNRELAKKAKIQGCKFHHHGTRHDFYYSPATGCIVGILRHWTQQVDAGTLSSIAKNLGIKL